MYKDIKVQSRYCRDWARRKRKGLVTRTTPLPKKLTEEELRERKRKHNTTQRIKKRNIINEHLGIKCVFCGYQDRLVTHRKDNKEHKRLMGLSISDLLMELKSKEYVYVCFHCHKGIHWCIEHLGFSWKKIQTIQKTRRPGFDSQLGVAPIV